MDEKGFLIGLLNMTRRIFIREQLEEGKLLGACQDGNRSWITLLACIGQDLQSLPPMLIYQGKESNFQDTWINDFDPETEEGYFSSSPTGWTNDQIGLEWLINIFDRHTKARARQGRDYRLLIIDGHGSHVTLAFLDWADTHRIIVAVFPSHSTHRLQPLDVSLFGPLSQAYTNQLVDFFAATQGLVGISKREFWGNFLPAFKASFTRANIESAWEKTGLLPWDPEVVYKQVRRKEEVSGEDPRPDPRPDSRPGTSGSSGSSVLSLSQVDARQLRRLFDRVIPREERRRNPKARKLEKTIESLQADREILLHEIKGLRKAITLEKKKRKRQRPLKNYLFDLEDAEQGAPIVFSPAKIQRARERKAEMEAQEQVEEARKRQEKVERELRKERQEVEKRQRAEERKRAQEERQRQKEEEKQQRIVTRQLKTDVMAQKRQEKELARQTKAERKARKEVNGKENQENLAGPSTSATADLPEAPQTPGRPTVIDGVSKPAHKSPKKKRQARRGANKPMLIVETDSEVLEAESPGRRPRRNAQLPKRFEDCELE
jgi:hypothetical protein